MAKILINSEDISLKTINKNLEIEIKDEDIEQTQSIGKTKMNEKNPQPISLKFAWENYWKIGISGENECKREKTCNNRKF